MIEKLDFRNILMIGLLSLILAACASKPSLPTATNTPVPTNTPAPTATTKPTLAPKATVTADFDPAEFLMPHGDPESEWMGIPIMPQAIAGEGDEKAYRFLVEGISREEVIAYYDERLPALNWEPMAVGKSDDGTPKLAIYNGAAGTLSLALIDGGDGQLIVMIVK